MISSRILQELTVEAILAVILLPLPLLLFLWIDHETYGMPFLAAYAATRLVCLAIRSVQP